jgi:UTP--glucose-1-phosphate uridylyltransferase
VLELPMIVNRKTVDPKDSSSPDVVQLETAMGAAIGAFEGAGAVHVPRDRFVPVKKTSDLLVVRSDAYRLGDDWTVRLVPEREGRPPHVELDSDYYKLVGDFEERFGAGPPSLAACDRLEVEGDVSFGRDVVVRGSVHLTGPRRIEDGTLLEG